MKQFIIGVAMLVPVAGFSYSFDKDVPADIQKQITDDMGFVTTITSEKASNLHKEIFGAVSGTVYKNFFEKRVYEIGLNSCGNANAVACVIPMWYPNKMWLTQNYIKFSHPQIARLMIVFHEARHTEDDFGNWPHATCPRPFLDANGKDMCSIWTGARLEGEPACDSTPKGSYGSSMIMLKNISKFCANCNEKVRMDAGIYADDQFWRITSERARKQIREDLYN